MRTVTTANLDYLTARLHGRRSRMAEAGRLDALCRLRSVPDLVRQVWPDSKVQAAAEFQRQLVAGLVREIVGFMPSLGGSGARLIEWMLVRLHVPRPTPPVSWTAFAASLPAGPLRKSVQTARGYPARPFFMEAALDRGYYRELLARAAALPETDRVVIEPLVLHEAITFQRNLLARGRLNYGLAPEMLAPFAVIHTGQTSELPVEAAAWDRLYRLANRAMRSSPTGLGMVVGYLALRRVELANLATLSEGLRLGLPDESIRTHLTPRSVPHV